MMQDRRIRRLPVVDPEGRPVGILSLNDLARQGAFFVVTGRMCVRARPTPRRGVNRRPQRGAGTLEPAGTVTADQSLPLPSR